MKNLIKILIRIVIYKKWLIDIDPFNWFVWPVWKHGETFDHKHIDIRHYMENGDDGITGVATHWKSTRKVFFLCFMFQYVIWQRTEAADIYPKGYDYKTDNDWKEKYDLLAKSGYYE